MDSLSTIKDPILDGSEYVYNLYAQIKEEGGNRLKSFWNSFFSIPMFIKDEYNKVASSS